MDAKLPAQVFMGAEFSLEPVAEFRTVKAAFEYADMLVREWAGVPDAFPIEVGSTETGRYKVLRISHDDGQAWTAPEVKVAS